MLLKLYVFQFYRKNSIGNLWEMGTKNEFIVDSFYTDAKQLTLVIRDNAKYNNHSFH